MDTLTRMEIEKENTKILKEIGITSPPIHVENVLNHLSLHRRFYNLEDPSLLQQFWHQVDVQKFKLFKLIKKVRLVAMWFPIESEIYIDSTLPKPKQKWATNHEIEHRILSWHRSFYLGDTVQTLEPGYQGMLEAEANYGTSYLMFCGELFKGEALDTIPEWGSIEFLKKRYSNSLVTTMRRYVTASHEIPMVAFISTPHWQQKPVEQPNRWRHFIKSNEFERRFKTINPDTILADIDNNTSKRKGGPVGDFCLSLKDINDDQHEFRAESFFNSYYILTFIGYRGELGRCGIIVP